jgi:hypothetical protein
MTVAMSSTVMAACSAGLPLIMGTGIAVGAAGILAGSTVLVAAGLLLGLRAWRCRTGHRHASRDLLRKGIAISTRRRTAVIGAVAVAAVPLGIGVAARGNDDKAGGRAAR